MSEFCFHLFVSIPLKCSLVMSLQLHFNQNDDMVHILFTTEKLETGNLSFLLEKSIHSLSSQLSI